MIRKSPSPVFEAARVRRRFEEFECLFREKVSERGVFEAPGSLLISEVILRLRWPNQPPEPTPTSVTARAFEPKAKSPDRTEIPFVARAVPAVVVAHL